MALMVDGQAVRDARMRKGETQKSLAEKALVVEQTVINVEQGHTQPRMTTVRRLAAALGVPVNELLRKKEVA
jgi:DNA-binding XRE family transcriptional regulator